MIGDKKKRDSLKWLAISVAAFGLMFLLVASAIAIISGGISSGNTAHIKIRGVITSGEDSLIGAETSSSEDVVASIEKAGEDKRIKAILLDINSPGGSAVASEEIASAIKNAEKPVVALIRDIGTSGAYWAASSADSIVASPLSITGSVGATASYLEFSGLMKKYGVGYERLVSGEFKDSGAPFRQLDEEERKMLQEMIESTGSYFVQSVRENRMLSEDAVKGISSAKIYSGTQAKELNLVDELGNIETAKEIVSELAGIESVKLVEYRTRKPLSIASLLSQQASLVGRSIGSSLIPSVNAVSLS